MIELSGVRKEYGGRCVLDIKSLRIERGKRYALLGANGSGKSTLLKILAGTVKQTEGAITSGVSGKKAVGYLPQTPYGFSFSVLKNVLLALDDEPERRAKAEAACEAVGMGALINADASKLSGGETQRMAFARIISMPRQLLLLDEPTAA
ncbi:MAG: ATP-binding cassette domain-containing protein, partial [Clostridiales bacterium]|nr:ATP-binding cassette domain-containing protein [Clostridiales bacterium]